MDLTKPSIRFCINNPRNLAERQDLIARGIPSKDCLGTCTACFNGRFLEIKGEITPGESYQEIFDSANHKHQAQQKTSIKKHPTETGGCDD